VSSQLTSRERVDAAINHCEPDRVPLSMTITVVPYKNLRDYLNLPTEEDLSPNRFLIIQSKFLGWIRLRSHLRLLIAFRWTCCGR